MDNNPPQINIIKSSSGGGMRLPKVSPLVIVLTTVLLAIVTVVSVFLLYQKRATPIAAPTPAAASTTQTISDDFNAPILDATKWTTTSSATGSTVTTGNKLTITIPSQTTSTIVQVLSPAITGDFDASVDIDPITSTAGTAGLTLIQSGTGRVAISRQIDSSGDQISSIFPGQTAAVVQSLPANTGVVTVRIARVGNVIQTYYKTTGNYLLVDSNLAAYTGDGQLRLSASPVPPAFPATTAAFDNFTALVNLAAVQPTPIPGSAAACELSFTVLDIVPTNTPGPTATPSPTVTGTPASTPTPTSTPPPGATPTPPQPTPASCNNTCTTNAQCTSGLICSNGACRNPQCTNDASCTCPVATPTPTTPLASGPTPTPVILQTAGSTTGTLLLAVGGALILGLGAILMFVL